MSGLLNLADNILCQIKTKLTTELSFYFRKYQPKDIIILCNYLWIRCPWLRMPQCINDWLLSIVEYNRSFKNDYSDMKQQ